MTTVLPAEPIRMQLHNCVSLPGSEDVYRLSRVLLVDLM